MSAKHIWALVGAIVIAGAGLAAAGCSSDDSSNGNPSPTQQDGSTSGNHDSGNMQGDSGNMQGDGGTQNDSGNSNCMSDAANCNSCPGSDPLNACSPATANCIKFDNSKVPANVPMP